MDSGLSGRGVRANSGAASRPLLLDARKASEAFGAGLTDVHPQAALVRLHIACYDAALGNYRAALEAARRALALPVAQPQNKYFGWLEATGSAMHVYALARRADLVVAQIEQLFRQTSGYAVQHAWLRLAPELEPVRSDPAFQALLRAHPGSGERYANE